MRNNNRNGIKPYYSFSQSQESSNSNGNYPKIDLYKCIAQYNKYTVHTYSYIVNTRAQKAGRSTSKLFAIYVKQSTFCVWPIRMWEAYAGLKLFEKMSNPILKARIISSV